MLAELAKISTNTVSLVGQIKMKYLNYFYYEQYNNNLAIIEITKKI